MRARCHIAMAASLVLVSAVPLGVGWPAVAAETTVLVSVDPNGQTVGDASIAPSISGDGSRIAFQSFSDEIVDGDANGSSDVFMRILDADVTERVSVDTGGGDPNAASGEPAVSANGRYVTFTSDASDLVANDNNGVPDIFRYDVRRDRTIRVSLGIPSGDPTRQVGLSSVSYDGTMVAFQVSGGSAPAQTDVYVRDVVAETTAKVNVTPSGGASDGSSFGPTISANGDYVAFLSSADDLVPRDGNGFTDVFRRSLDRERTILVSPDRFGGAADAGALFGPPAISARGRYVVFHDEAGDLVSRDTNGEPDVFRRDVVAGKTVRVSITSEEEEVSGFGGFHTVRMGVSRRGKSVTFSSDFTGLTSDDRNGQPDVFVRDVVDGTTTLVSVSVLGTSPNGFSTHPSISADGRYVGFTSSADQLTAEDDNGFDDVFRRQLF